MGGVVKSRERQARADSAPVSTGFRATKKYRARPPGRVYAVRTSRAKTEISAHEPNSIARRSYKTSRPKLDYVGFNSQEVGNAS